MSAWGREREGEAAYRRAVTCLVDPTAVVPGALAVKCAGGIRVAGLKIRLAVYRFMLTSEYIRLYTLGRKPSW